MLRNSPRVQMMKKNNVMADIHDPWEAVTWHGCAQAHCRDFARLSFTRKLEWLEQAGRLMAVASRGAAQVPGRRDINIEH